MRYEDKDETNETSNEIMDLYVKVIRGASAEALGKLCRDIQLVTGMAEKETNIGLPYMLSCCIGNLSERFFKILNDAPEEIQKGFAKIAERVRSETRAGNPLVQALSEMFAQQEKELSSKSPVQ